MEHRLISFSQTINHTFKDITILERALRHRSAGTPHNERLEFLGDAVLEFVISTELYNRHQDAKEGDLSRMRSSLVNGKVLAKLALDFEVDKYLELGSGERKSGGAKRQSILADAMEALIGAIYLDAGIEVAAQCVIGWYGECVDDLSQMKPEKDAKSQLQEWLQARGLPLPTYDSKVRGQAHALTFTVTCSVKGLAHQTQGESTSRQKAEQLAAREYLKVVRETE